MSFTSRQVSIAGSMLHYRIAGPETAPTLLFLHGAGGADSALGVLAGFTDRWQVIVPDHPGFGASADPEWLDTIHDAAYAYLDFLEALDLRQVHLVGSSLGGWLAMEIAIRDASRLARLTLIAAAGIRPGDIPTGDLFMWSPEERVRHTIADPQLAEKILAMPQTPEQTEIALRNHFTTAKLAWEPRFFDPHLDKWLHRLRLPVQVIWGEQDRLFPLELGRKLAALMPAARFDVIPGCGHVPTVENPALLSALLREFQGSTP